MSITDNRPHTAEQVEQGIHRALEARDFEAVVSLLKYLCTIDARRASDMYDMMLLGVHAGQLGITAEELGLNP